ncbi:hypothetical protein [Moheibacter sediminis]|uniref:Uncharacterized protein n=1 Tax=Moheibacter sediminis TaxID=1434700 RepID=A0A1W2C7V9_9FLAO|nr:hypothetical protein [Moheibacter sediminis]SMC81186.1 hypothetical protein SAMN06296427_10931 [Moheibacter sediminis]
MKNILSIVLIAFATLISFTRSCKNTSKAIKSIDNASPAYIKYADNVEMNNASTKNAAKVVSDVKTSSDLYKIFADAKKDSIKKSSP